MRRQTSVPDDPDAPEPIIRTPYGVFTSDQFAAAEVVIDGVPLVAYVPEKCVRRATEKVPIDER